MKYLHTTSDYVTAIEREQAKRSTTYPKILLKMKKNGQMEAVIAAQFQMQGIQNQRLNLALTAIRDGKIESHVSVVFQELVREFKLRKKLYPYFIFKHLITEDTANIEISVWRELTIYFAETFLGDAQLAIDALETKRRKRNAESNTG